jgi:hypothetical protein
MICRFRRLAGLESAVERLDVVTLGLPKLRPSKRIGSPIAVDSVMSPPP